MTVRTLRATTVVPFEAVIVTDQRPAPSATVHVATRKRPVARSRHLPPTDRLDAEPPLAVIPKRFAPLGAVNVLRTEPPRMNHCALSDATRVELEVGVTGTATASDVEAVEPAAFRAVT